MRWPRPTRTEALLAAGCAAWSGAFLAGEGAAALALAPLGGAAVLAYRRLPEAAALGVLAAVLASDAAGVSEESPAWLAPQLVAAYGLGAHGPARGLAVLAALAAGVAAQGELTAPDLLFVSVVLLATWACGRLVGRRTRRARAAEAEAARLAAADPAEIARRVVAEERARLAGDALAVVREAVAAMQRHAVQADRDLDPDALAAVGHAGRAAVTDLRRLLGLLRASPDDEAGDGTAPAPAEPPPGRRRRAALAVDAPLAGGLVALAAAEAVLIAPEPAAAATVAAMALAACVAVRRLDAAAACAAAAACCGAALAMDAPPVLRFAVPAALALLAWSAGGDPRGRALAALCVLTVLAVAVARADEPGNEGILLLTVAVPAVGGRLWAARGRAGQAAAAATAALRESHARLAERAAHAERLRLARELHDVASHAVGVMVLQASAAEALRERDPAAARRALQEVERAGSAALAELDLLFGVLDRGVVGPAGLAAATPPGDLLAALRQLVARLGGAGLDVTLTAPEGLSVPPALAATSLRVVQEALTNAARHAPGSRVQVRLEAGPAWLTVEVRDDGPADAAAGAGFGLVGLAERVRALDGEFQAGSAPGGGFAVLARLPLAATERVAT